MTDINIHLKKTRKKRIELSNKMLGVIEGILQRSKDKEARDVYAFLEGSTVYGEPIYEDGKGPGVLRHAEDGEKEKTAAVFLLEEDTKLNDYIQNVMEGGEFHGHLGKYLEEWRTIFIDTSEPMSDLWLALIFLHEGAHAFYHFEDRYRENHERFWHEERDVLKMEIRLVRQLGGERYEDVVNSHLQILRDTAEINKNGIEKIVRPNMYPEELDRVFSKARSSRETSVRMNILFYDALFTYIEEVYKDDALNDQANFLEQEAKTFRE